MQARCGCGLGCDVLPDLISMARLAARHGRRAREMDVLYAVYRDAPCPNAACRALRKRDECVRVRSPRARRVVAGAWMEAM